MYKNKIIHVTVPYKEKPPTRHLESSQSSPNFACLQAIVGLTGAIVSSNTIVLEISYFCLQVNKSKFIWSNCIFWANCFRNIINTQLYL